jgi:hypothetical protein
MMKNLYVLSLFITVTTAVSSCAYVPYAREAKRKPREGGIIALRTNHNAEDRAKADGLMAGNCGSGYAPKVTEEGEVVVGERTSGSASRGRENRASGFSLGGFSLGGSAPSDVTNTVTETSQVKEWQIAYTCEHVKI